LGLSQSIIGQSLKFLKKSHRQTLREQKERIKKALWRETAIIRPQCFLVKEIVLGFGFFFIFIASGPVALRFRFGRRFRFGTLAAAKILSINGKCLIVFVFIFVTGSTACENRACAKDHH